MPMPRAIPLTSCVLPVPRSPLTPMTRPLRTVRPHDLPSASVSSGLCEMFVAMGSERAGAGFIAEHDAVAFRDFADAGEVQFEKLLFPLVEHRYCSHEGHREQLLTAFAFR